MATPTLSDIRAQILSALLERVQSGVTEFREGSDMARFSSALDLLRALEKTGEPDVIQAASPGTGRATFTPVSDLG